MGSNLDFPRMCELRDLAERSGSPDAYFQNFYERIENPVSLKHFRDIEEELQGLNSNAWEHLKAEVTPLVTTQDPLRGWQALFDKLNEAKAFNYLGSIGCTGVRFIPRSALPGKKSPDLEANRNGKPVLCEVKTINTSKKELVRRKNFAVGNTVVQLETGFFEKLRSDLEVALAGCCKTLAFTLID